MGIKTSSLCSMCRFQNELWPALEDWIIELGFQSFIMSNRTVVLDDTENTLGFKSIILLTKRSSITVWKRRNKLAVKTEMKNLYNQEKYRLCMNGHKVQFEKRYSFLKNIFLPLVMHNYCLDNTIVSAQIDMFKNE